MAKEYLQDIKFLKDLDEMRIREHFIRITVLNFKEEPLRQIQGIATAGSITVNGSSAVRRTINLTLVALESENDLSNVDNIICFNKKIKVEAGIKNPFKEYSKYGEIVWFPLGVFLITEATSSTSATTATITIKGKDKMCMLDGTCGGVLPSTVSFHEAQEIDSNGKVSIVKIPIFTIIKECVRHYGQEIEQNIIINDVDLVAKQSVQYIGKEPVWFDEDFLMPPLFGDIIDNRAEYTKKFVYGQDVGYMETDFTFPGELVFSAGETVTDVLDKIIQTLGNYEYFYDLDGHFVFQEKKNYLNHYYTPVTEINDYYYIRAFSDDKYYKTFENAKDTLSYFNSPRYDNIKNDFVVWGSYTNKDGVTNNIKYHLAIDEKPILDLVYQYMWDVTDGNNNHLFYVLDYENKEEYNFTGIERKPIPLNLSSNLNEAEVVEYITNYVNKNYVDNLNIDIAFTLWIRVIWNKKVRYYSVRVSDKKIQYIVPDDRYTIDLKEENLIIGVQNFKEENKNDEEGEGFLPDSNPGMNTENKQPSRKSREKENETPKEEEKTPFIALDIQQIDGLFYLGFQKDEETWEKVYEIGKEKNISLKDFNNILLKIAEKYIVRVFIPNNFNEENAYNFNIINTINNTSMAVKNVALQELKINNSNAKFLYDFKDLLYSNKTVLEAAEREKLIKYLVQFFPDQALELNQDIISIYNEGKGNDLLPNYNPDMDTENKWDMEESVKKLVEIIKNGKNNPFKVIDKENLNDENKDNDYEYSKLIYKYASSGKTVDDLMNEVSSYWKNYTVDFSSIKDNYILNIRTEDIVDPALQWGENLYYNLIGNAAEPLKGEWREELYRQALLNKDSAGQAGYYDEELLAFWRNNFDNTNENWRAEWEDFINLDDNQPWEGWNPNIYKDPGLITFWLDFLDNEQLVAKYSVNQIGRRTTALVKENIKYLYKLEVPDVIFFSNQDENIINKKNEYIQDGQRCCVLKPSQMNYFSSSSTGNTAFDLIREMLYSHLSYNTSITINSIPKYYLEPNNLIYISDSKSNIQGDFIIQQFTIPLTFNGTMSISATQALTRV